MTMTTEPILTRDIRQRELIPPEKLANCHAIVIGVGAIGRQVAIQLAAVGVPAITLFDHDTVGVENLAPQAFWERDIGKPKVIATAEICMLLNPAVNVIMLAERFRRSSNRNLAFFDEAHSAPIVFCCVDSIAARQLVWETVQSKASLFIDARMSAEVIRILAVNEPIDDTYYAGSLFSQDQAYAGSCTAKSTIYTASIAAGFMLSAFTRWLRGMAVEQDMTLNLLASELAVGTV